MPSLISLEIEIPNMEDPALRSKIAAKLGRDYLWLKRPTWSVVFWGLSRPSRDSDPYGYRGPTFKASPLPFPARWILACLVHLALVFRCGPGCLLVAPNPGLALGVVIGRSLMRKPPPLLVKVVARLGSKAREVHSSRLRSAVIQGVERLVLRSADIVLVRGDFTRQEAIMAGADPRRIVVVPGQPAWGELSTPPDSAWERKRSGELLFAGRLESEKGADILLLALKETGPDPQVRLLLAGEGPEQGELRRLSRELGIDSQVEFLGHVPPGELRRLYARAWAVVLPSRVEEGLPRVLVEGALHGCALVGSDHGGIRDVIRDGVSGLLFKPGDPVSLGKAITRITRDPALAARLGAGAKVHGESTLLTRESGLRDLERLVEKVCGT